jgi:hypothetical protein
MPNTFKGASGELPVACFDSPVTPYLGTPVPAATAPAQGDGPIVHVTDYLQACQSPIGCPSGGCCQSGAGSGPGGPPPGGPGGGPPVNMPE